jgi:hypothetical protein
MLLLLVTQRGYSDKILSIKLLFHQVSLHNIVGLINLKLLFKLILETLALLIHFGYKASLTILSTLGIL